MKSAKLMPCKAWRGLRFAGAAGFFFAPAAALAFVSSAGHFPAVKTSSPPPLSAVATAPVWQRALTARDFIDFSNRRAAEYATTAYFLYDDTNLYVAFHCAQGGVPITAAQRIDHAGVGSDDHVSFDIDTSGNGSRTYTFRVNPIGIHDESSSENTRYAPPWQSLASVGRSGDYDVMMVIPLSDIRAQAAPVQQWRFNFERFIAARNVDYTWAYQPVMQNTTSVQFWPWLTQIRIASAARPKPQADAFVLESAGSQRNVFQNGIGEFQQQSPRVAGLDVTYPFTNTLAFVGTLNPDFSNVEEDQTSIQPQEFQKAYQEYRPFFSQGAQYINAVPQIGAFGGSSMFYTPSIGIFNRGLKVEGTAGQNAVGLLNVVGPGLDDDALGYAFTTPNGDAGVSTEDVVANHDGVRDETGGYGLARINPHSGETTQVEFASESNTLTGAAHDFNVTEGLHNQHFNLAAFYRDTSPGYGPIDGYTAINDARGPALTAGYNGTGSARSPVLSYTASVTSDRYLATDGSVHEADINAFYNLQFRDLVSLQGFFGPSELQVAPGVIDSFNRRQIQLGYRESTPQPVTLGYTWGPFSGFYVQQTNAGATRVFGAYDAAIEYDGNIERTSAGGPIFNSQWLRRLTVSRSFGHDSSIGIALRSINGTGGFALPGTNFSLLYQKRFPNQDLLYLEYGTPAAVQTLHRLIVKYVFHAGGGSGT